MECAKLCSQYSIEMASNKAFSRNFQHLVPYDKSKFAVNAISKIKVAGFNRHYYR
jgi:hypothetical protein